MLCVAFCDDEPYVRKQLRKAILRFSEEKKIELNLQEFDSCDTLLKNYPQQLDLLLLDIGMVGINGMEAAREIRKFDTKVYIIFITMMYQRAIEGYAVRAFGFIKKPVHYAELRHELTCAVRGILHQRETEHFVTIHSKGRDYRLSAERIVYCEVRGHCMRVCMEDGVGEYRCTIRELETQLAPYGFFRCHAAYLVSGKQICEIGATYLKLMDGTEIPISQRRKKDFLSALSGYLGGDR